MKELMKKNAKLGWGNKFGIMLLPIYYHKKGSDPLLYLKRAKKMIDRKKLSIEAFLSYQIGNFVMSWFGPKVKLYDFFLIFLSTYSKKYFMM